MKTRSAKAKGRRLQNWLREKIIQYWNIPSSDIRCAIMGETGSDIKINERHWTDYPFAFECKNQEITKTIYKMYMQARSSNILEPVLVIKCNNNPPLVIVDAETFLKVINGRK